MKDDQRLLSDEQARVLRLRAEGSTEGWRILAGALLVDRAARVERQAADVALLDRALGVVQIHAEEIEAREGFAGWSRETERMIRARLAGAQP